MYFIMRHAIIKIRENNLNRKHMIKIITRIVIDPWLLLLVSVIDERIGGQMIVNLTRTLWLICFRQKKKRRLTTRSLSAKR